MKRTPKQMIQKFNTLRAQGLTYREIAERTGASQFTIRKYCTEGSIEPVTFQGETKETDLTETPIVALVGVPREVAKVISTLILERR